MTVFFTSDTHFGHARIIELCNRPFKDVDHMNEVIVARWNAAVSPEDTVYHLGDVAMGPIEKSLAIIKRLNGSKILVQGNHDRPFMAGDNYEKFEKWHRAYIDAGFLSVWDYHYFQNFLYPFALSHFPYDGDSHDGDRFSDKRLRDAGLPLIHGHTHATGNPVTFSKNGTFQYHVGVDAAEHGFAPVPLIRIIDALDANR